MTISSKEFENKAKELGGLDELENYLRSGKPNASYEAQGLEYVLRIKSEKLEQLRHEQTIAVAETANNISVQANQLSKTAIVISIIAILISSAIAIYELVK